ncbi:MAG: polysaccharide biosynthesis/export family protein [Terriglobia bacterium]
MMGKVSIRLVLFAVALTFGLGCGEEPSLIADDHVPQTVPSQVTAKGSLAQTTPSLQRRNPRYQIETADVLDLTFPFTPEFNQTVTVQPDGYINLKSVGDIHVEGLTVPDTQKAIIKAYEGILREPQVSVTLKEFDRPSFMALGQVQKPGKYDLRGDTTVSEAVAIAGGFNEKAKHSQVLVFRRVSNDWVEVRKINLKQMLTKGDLAEDLHLQPGDLVFVPQNRISKIKPLIPFPTLGYYFRY